MFSLCAALNQHTAPPSYAERRCEGCTQRALLKYTAAGLGRMHGLGKARAVEEEAYDIEEPMSPGLGDNMHAQPLQ